MAPLAVAWEDLSESLRSALAWARGSERGVVGTRAVLAGLVRAGDSDGEAAQLLRAVGCSPEDLFEALQLVRVSPTLDLSAARAEALTDFPPLTRNLERAFELAMERKQSREADQPLDTRHVLGAFLDLPDSTAYQGLDAAFGQRVPVGQLTDIYRQYLDQPGESSLADLLAARVTAVPGVASPQARFDGVCALAFSPRDGHLVTGDEDGCVRVMDRDLGAIVAEHDDHEGAVRVVAFSPNGARLATAGSDGTVRLRDPATGATINVLRGHTGRVRALAFSHDGRRLASSCTDMAVRLWALGEREVSVAVGQVDAVALTFSPAGDRLLVVTNGGDVWQWGFDLENGRTLVEGSDDGLEAVAWSPDGSGYAWADAHGTIGVTEVWGPVAGTVKYEFHGHDGEGTALAFSPDGALLASADAEGAVWLSSLVSGTSSAALQHHRGVVQAVAFAHGAAQLASVGDDGTLLLHDAEGARESNELDWVTDAVATADRLGRKHLTEALVRRLLRMSDDDPGSSFLIHVDGPWGAGKSTLVDYVGQRLRAEGWLVVRFDAWRQSRVGPPWWALLTSLRTTLRTDPGVPGFRLRVAETWERLRRDRASYLASATILAVAVAAFLLLGSVSSEGGELARSFSALVAVLTLVSVGGRVVARFLMWESAAGARVYERSQQDPMEGLATHFAWLVARFPRRVVFLIDDLDRCSDAYVVDLLDSVQTLVRDASGPTSDDERPGDHPYFVVAADGRWIRTSYERTYDCFEAAVGEPGRPLGYLFLDKIFQLTVQVPAIATDQQPAFLKTLVGAVGDAGPDETAAELEVQTERIGQSASEESVVDVMNSASPGARIELAAAAIEKLSDPRVERATTHRLEKFAPLLERNPRSMKRFVNAYSMALSIALLEGRRVDPDSLAVWTILRMRWPDLAEHLQANPGQIEELREPDRQWDPPERLSGLSDSADLREVAGFRGGLLSAELICELAATDRRPRAD